MGAGLGVVREDAPPSPTVVGAGIGIYNVCRGSTGRSGAINPCL